MTLLDPLAPTRHDALAASIAELEGAIAALARGGSAWPLRPALAHVRDALLAERAEAGEAWLAARGEATLRAGRVLLERVGALGVRLPHDPGAQLDDLRRLALDLTHHAQRRRDLAWDAVEMELGGSE